jgi:predicted acetyltransferase
MDLELCSPAVAFHDTYLSGLDELETDSDRSAWIYLGVKAPRDIPRRDFASYVEMLRAREHSAPTDFVTDTVYWAIRGGQMVGRISLRHELNDFLRREGGHVGYVVRPSARNQGVATEMLRRVLRTERARSLGQLLLTCDEDNLASEKTIRNNGGILESVIDVGAGKRRKKRFWIAAR